MAYGRRTADGCTDPQGIRPFGGGRLPDTGLYAARPGICLASKAYAIYKGSGRPGQDDVYYSIIMTLN